MTYRPHLMVRAAPCLAALFANYANGCSPKAPPVNVPGSPGTGLALSSTAVHPASDAAASLHAVHVQVLAFNDFHGNLEPPTGSNGVVLAAADDPVVATVGAEASDGGGVRVPAGGAAYLVAHVALLRAENPNTVVVSAGDLTGASPLVSNLFRDEPAILVMNRLGLDFEGVGNHDFDRGIPELMRLQKPGCVLGDCDGGPFPGASFEYLGANVVDVATGRPLFAPYAIRDFDGARVAFIGETLTQTPTVTTADAVKGLSFADEATTANSLIPGLKAQGVSAIVLVLHQGGTQSRGGTYDGCQGLSGDLLPILENLSPAVDVVVSGHTHQTYDCLIAGRIVTSAGSYGRVVTQIDLTIDRASHRVIEKHARNVVVTREVPPDPQVDALVHRLEDETRAVASRVVGYVKRDLTGSHRSAGAPSCETPLGDLVADAMRHATGASIAFLNPGGMRADLVAKRKGRPDSAITFGEAFDVQPFGNRLITLTLTGSQIRALLEAQFPSVAEPRILQVSKGFAYRYSYDRTHRQGSIKDMRLDGRPVVDAEKYRVTAPSFLADGGDGFSIFLAGRDRQIGPVDVDALTLYLAKTTSRAAPFDPPRTSRIEGNGCK